jgi:hypothetical protein
VFGKVSEHVRVDFTYGSVRVNFDACGWGLCEQSKRGRKPEDE